MIDKSSEDLDNYLNNLRNKAHEVRFEINGKSGLTFLFYYLGHGAMLDGFTHIIFNEDN